MFQKRIFGSVAREYITAGQGKNACTWLEAVGLIIERGEKVAQWKENEHQRGSDFLQAADAVDSPDPAIIPDEIVFKAIVFDFLVPGHFAG